MVCTVRNYEIGSSFRVVVVRNFISGACVGGYLVYFLLNSVFNLSLFYFNRGNPEGTKSCFKYTRSSIDLSYVIITKSI